MQTEKRNTITRLTSGAFGNNRFSKSPLPPKKGSAQVQTQAKQNLRQLGLSYGIITKHDVSNKLVSSKKRVEPAKDSSPKKNREKKYSLGFKGHIHFEETPVMLLEGSQINTSPKQQNEKTQVLEKVKSIQQQNNSSSLLSSPQRFQSVKVPAP